MTARLGVHYVAEPRPRRYDPNEHLSRRHLPGKHNQKTHGGHGAAGAGIHPATARELDDKVDQLQAKDPEKYWMVSKTHKGAKGYAINADDGSRKGYVALYEHDGGKTVEIGTLVAEPGSRGVVADAMKATDDLHPNAKQKLDCFDGHLPTIYAKHGFVETGRVKWDDQYAPDVWKPEYGRPDVVFMERPPAVERRSRANGATHHYDARHLPGKHNQKTHGHDEGAGGYTPGAWKKTSNEARIKQLQANLEEDLSPSAKKQMIEADGPDAVRKLAEEMADANGVVYTNGKHVVAFESTKVGAAQQRGFLDDVDHWQTEAPVDQISIRIQDSTNFPEGVGGETFTGTGNMRINESVFDTFNTGSGTMPMSKKVVAAKYVLAHEWGHAVDNQSHLGGDIDPGVDLSLSMSTYGWRGGPYEAYAEAFAEWGLSRGQTSNQAAQAYAKAYGWGERWPSLSTTSKAA